MKTINKVNSIYPLFNKAPINHQQLKKIVATKQQESLQNLRKHINHPTPKINEIGR